MAQLCRPRVRCCLRQIDFSILFQNYQFKKNRFSKFFKFLPKICFFIIKKLKLRLFCIWGKFHKINRFGKIKIKKQNKVFNIMHLRNKMTQTNSFDFPGKNLNSIATINQISKKSIQYHFHQHQGYKPTNNITYRDRGRFILNLLLGFQSNHIQINCTNKILSKPYLINSHRS